VLLPLTFGSNVFVPTATLPGWLQGFVEINPVSKGRRRGPRPTHRRRSVGAGHHGVDRLCGAGRGVRAAGGGALPAADVSAAVTDP
jgi:hypothetical protein